MRLGEFDAHMAKAAETDDADLLARPHFPVPQRRIGGDAGAQQRRHRLEVEIFRHLRDETLLDHDLFGIAAEGEVFRFPLATVIGPREAFFAELFEIGLARRAMAAGIDHAADGGEIAGLEPGHTGADLDHPADDLVAGHHRIERIAPVVAGLMQVGMADAAIENVDLHVVRAGVAALDAEGPERGRGGLRGESFDFEHGGRS